MALLIGSTMTPTVAIGPPSAGIHPQVCSPMKPLCQTITAATNETAIAAIESAPAPRPVRRIGGTIARIRNATNGIAGTRRGSRRLRSTRLSPQEVEAVGVDRPPDAEDRDDDREADSDLDHRDGDREQRED